MASTVGTGRATGPAAYGRVRWRLTPRSGLAVLGAEVRKGLTSAWSHPIGHVVAVVMGATMFLAMQYAMGQGSLRRDLLPQAVIAMSAFWFLLYASLVMVSDLIEEKQGGTFATAHMTPTPLGLVIMLNGSFLPVALYPDWLHVLARFIPTTLGIEAANKLLFGNASLGEIWADGLLPWTIGYTVALCVAGWLIFVHNHRKAMRDGRLGQY